MQIWDKDLLNPNDIIAEAVLNLSGARCCASCAPHTVGTASASLRIEPLRRRVNSFPLLPDRRQRSRPSR
jgi:hypothetical protein